MFLGYLQWADSGGVRPFEFYEHIVAGDASTRAGHYRDLLDNWLRRVHARPSGQPLTSSA